MGFGIYIKISDNFKIVNELYNISEAFRSGIFQWVNLGMILVGALTAVVAAFGCIGALAHKRMLMYIYALSLIFIVIVELAAFITTLVYRKDIWNTFDSGYLTFFEHSYEQNLTDAIDIIHNLERQFKCCGVDSFSDYLSHSWSIPNSCYSDPSLIPTSIYTEGCALAVADWFWDKLPIIAGVLIGVVIVEVFGIIASLVLGVAISHSARVKSYEQF